eukprot:TRINITY_DN726_c0_g1_i6.p1 TRINITY_DN726_c0_g1~~TRINITY_DN726_c0_g1_i6.p1  ORF type:complete len:352 (-),score=83.61 TRINITY_DN726_c0_g1_i6:162-1217(-)
MDAFNAPGYKMPKGMSEGLRKCFKILQQLRKHPNATPFLEPVDAEALGIPEYYSIITEPMDLSTVEAKLRNNDYTSPAQFAVDVRKIWNNSFRFNAKGSEIYLMTSDMSSYFEKLFREVETSFPGTDSYQVQVLQRQLDKLQREFKELNNTKTGTKPVGISGGKRTKSDAGLDREMTSQEKKVLGQHIRSLPPDYLKGVWEIVSEGLPHNQQNKEEIEFDIDTLPTRKVRELERYVKNKLAQLNKANGKKAKSSSKGQSGGAAQVGMEKSGNVLKATNPAHRPEPYPMSHNMADSPPSEAKAAPPPPMFSNQNVTFEGLPVKGQKDPIKRIMSSESSFISDSDDSLMDNDN